ncbi:MAG: hypothetical protein ACPLX8_02075, partial [Nanopusillaceae archaeon]
MIIVTSQYVHYNMRYYDMNKAGPSLLKYIYNIDLTNLDKKERNEKYGLLMKMDDKYKMIPTMLYSISRILCKENEGIIYTQDSIITKRIINNNSILENLVVKFKQVWFAPILVINKNRNSYVAISGSETIIKGPAKNQVSEYLVNKLLKFVIEEPDWLTKFKRWYKSIKDPEYFIINDNSIISTSGM